MSDFDPASLTGAKMARCTETMRSAMESRGSRGPIRFFRAGFYLTVFLPTIVAAGAVGPAEAKSANAVQITLSDMIRSKMNAAQVCTIVYSVKNSARRHIGEIFFTFNSQDGYYFSDKIYDIRPRATVDKFLGNSKEVGDDPQSALRDCGQFARTLIDIVKNRHGPNIHGCVMDKTPEAACPPMVKIQIGPRFLENATDADEHFREP